MNMMFGLGLASVKPVVIPIAIVSKSRCILNFLSKRTSHFDPGDGLVQDNKLRGSYKKLVF
jgi:hypothetical protein